MPIDYSRIVKKLNEGKYSSSASPSFQQTVREDEIQDEPVNMDTSSGGIFSNLARSLAQTPLRFASTGLTAAKSALQLGMGDQAGAERTLERGTDLARGVESALGYKEGDITDAYKIGQDVEEGGGFGRNTLETFGAGAELASYGMALPQAVGAVKLAKGANTAKELAKIGFSTAKKEAVGSAIGSAGATAQDEDATAGDILKSGVYGYGTGLVLGTAVPFAAKGVEKLGQASSKAIRGMRDFSSASDSFVEAVSKQKGGALAQAADDVVEAAKRKEAGITEATHWTKQVPEDPKPFEGALHDLDDDLFPPKAPDATPIEESLKKRAIKNGIREGRINTIAEMSQAERADALKAMDMAEYKEMHESARHPNVVAAKPIMDQVNYLQKVKSQAGAALDGLVASMPKEPLPLNEPTQVIRAWLDDKGVKILFDDKGVPVLDFENSLFKGGSSSGDRKIIQEVFDELHPPKAKGRIIFRTPEEIRMMRQRLFKLAQDNKKSAQPFSDVLSPLIDNVRESLQEPLAALSPKYAEMNQKYAVAKDGLTKFMKYLGKDFYGKEDEVLEGKIAEILPRLISNTGEKHGVILRDLSDSAVRAGFPKEAVRDPRRMILFTDGLDDLYDLVNPRSAKATVTRGIDTVMQGGKATYDAFTGHPIQGAVGFADIIKGKVKDLVPDVRKKQRQLLREMLESTAPLKQEKILEQAENLAEKAVD